MLARRPGSSAAAADDDQAALSAHAQALTLTRALPPPKQKAEARSRGSLKGASTRFFLLPDSLPKPVTEENFPQMEIATEVLTQVVAFPVLQLGLKQSSGRGTN